MRGLSSYNEVTRVFLDIKLIFIYKWPMPQNILRNSLNVAFLDEK